MGGFDLTRRQLLQQASLGFGALAASALFAEEGLAAPQAVDPLAPKSPHFRPRASSVIFMYMDGGISQVDSFDPKPRLSAENGRPRPFSIKTAICLRARGDLSGMAKAGFPSVTCSPISGPSPTNSA